jgi:DAK2 domain fusion protein YloV
MVYAGLVWLQNHQEAVNALNVFPVPDGDTGINMVLTMQSAWKEIADSAEQHVGTVAHQVAHGALMGARGNSGVILSQVWRGMARALDGKAALNGEDLAAAMREGAQTAYKGVIRPVEGTILTVAREVAEEVTAAVKDSTDLTYLMERMVYRARDAVARTPTMLSVLAEAGVVDAGGQGLCLILEGMLRYMHGEAIMEEALSARPQGVVEAVVAGGQEYGYDVQFLIVGQNLDVAAIRAAIDAMGESTLVVGDASVVKVHVHVPNPGVPLTYAATLGSLRDVVVEDMQAQYEQFTAGRAEPPPLPSPVAETEIATVAVVAGDGLARVFQSLGVAAIVPGGQTMNPSTEEILKVIESLPNQRVILLPNNKNIIMAAQQASELSQKQVVVVPTQTIPQGIAALLAFNFQADLEDNARQMARAARGVLTGEITTATRDVSLNGLTVRQGQAIGLLDDELVVAAESRDEAARQMLERMGADNLEIVTLYFGAGVTESEAQALVEQLQEIAPNAEFEIHEGGQPHYFYIISAE